MKWLGIRSALDPVRWAESTCGFAAEPWQRQILRSRSRLLALNVTRQGGKSSLAAILAAHRAVHVPGSVVLIAGPSLRQAHEDARKVKSYLHAAGQQLASDNAAEMELQNGSRIVIAPASGEGSTSRGFALDLLIVDEASRVQDEALASLRPMLAGRKGSRLLYLSTPSGQRGAFHAACTDPALGFEVVTVSAADVPHIDRDWLRAERAALGPRSFAQEYCCEFTETDAALFDLDVLRACLDPSVQPLFGPAGAVAQAAHLGTLLNNMQPLTVN